MPGTRVDHHIDDVLALFDAELDLDTDETLLIDRLDGWDNPVMDGITTTTVTVCWMTLPDLAEAA